MSSIIASCRLLHKSGLHLPQCTTVMQGIVAISTHWL
jgi:hypothetical protein